MRFIVFSCPLLGGDATREGHRHVLSLALWHGTLTLCAHRPFEQPSRPRHSGGPPSHILLLMAPLFEEVVQTQTPRPIEPRSNTIQ